ncbi:DUF87 domain-containing protein [Sporosarcina sp. Te-1]|nr:DUF87 domain-containing protein [Sporosarcina sp. Te-1]
MLTWFKRVLNRIVKTDREHETDTEIDLEYEYEQVTNEEQQEQRIDSEPKHSPSFRFPIITDAEIYGWDEEEIVERSNPSTPPQELPEDDFEPVPLYENERWPGRNESVTIHRTESERRLDKSVLRVTGATMETALEPKYEKKQTNKPARNRPFTPTQVPSPVYGFRKPKKNVQTEDGLPFPESHADEPEVHIEADTKAMPYENTDLPFLEKDETNLQKDVPASSIVVELPEPEEMEELQQEQQIGHEVEEVQEDEFICEEPEETDIDNAEEPEPEFSEEMEAIADEVPTVEDETEDYVGDSHAEDEFVMDAEEESIIEEPVEREKVVPFNVLMLKSDKMKIDLTADRTIQNSEPTVSKTETVEEIIEPIVEEEEPYYAFPSLDLLIQPEEHIEDVEWLESQSVKLEEALSYFSIQANVMEAVQGPTVTRFELTVGHGTKVSKIRNLTDDLKLALAAEDIRIQAPIPGTSSIGIEIPNRRTRAVRISEVIQTERFRQSTSPLEAVLGLSLTGEPVTLDLRKMPHGMIAGATGSGKSVCINSILTSLMYKASPTDVKLLLIDPKMVELAPYNGVPHLLSPVITDVKAATAALKWAVDEMERRYELFAHAGARNIERYNEMVTDSRQFSLKMPYLLIVIDELADLMMTAPADVEVSISRITQKARACGIHLIIATQRPSVDVITGTIKANVPTRIAFSVSSQVDSRTIIDTPGAERLLGKGDMLYLGNGQSSSVRLQGTFVTDEEIERIIEHVQNEAKPDYLFGQEDLLANSIEEEETDPLFEEACKFIIEHGSASTSLLQRNFGIGYNRAAKLMDKMEKLAFISEQKGSKPRDVYLTQQDFEQYLNRFEQN